jgi:hypothetical protein
MFLKLAVIYWRIRYWTMDVRQYFQNPDNFRFSVVMERAHRIVNTERNERFYS